MKNRYGVDITYFEKELDALKASLPNRTPEELKLYLLRLANIVSDHIVDTNEKVEFHGCDCSMPDSITGEMPIERFKCGRKGGDS